MNVCSIEFVAAVLLGAALYQFLPSTRLRRLALAAANALALYLLVPDFRTALVLAAFLLSGYACARMLKAYPSRLLLGGYLALLLAAFVILKRYDFLTVLFGQTLFVLSVQVVGLSYMLFRQIHFLVDSYQGQVESPSLWTYLNYQLNLFAILAGPIQRYQDFNSEWQTLEPPFKDGYDVLKNYLRLFAGVLKVAGLAPVFLSASQELFPAVAYGSVAGWKWFVEFAVVFYAYPLYVYFNFSGYCDIVIAASSFFGVRLPENFDRPYLARNVIEYWTRWHRTLGFWIRDYLFTPMYKTIAENWPSRAASLAFACYFVAFTLAGVWHGSTMNFLVFGLLQGAGASAVKLYENRILRRGGRPALREYLKSRSTHVAAVLANLHFQCLAFLFFSVSLPEAWAVLTTLAARVTGR
jgi:D-alanyl-lipoteichoic acid acyltransferase DltB (MBOAT superfamily)